MQSPAAAGVGSAPDRRSTDLALARLHLRVGSLALARAEFETLVGRDALDDDALVDLAEARWRTGELGPAGEAAASALDHGVGAPIALIIAAEAAFALGRPGEARRLATRAMSAAGGTLDALFAGMPRSSVWPPDPADPVPTATTLFGDDGADAAAGHQGEPEAMRPVADAPAAAVIVADASTPGLWDQDGVPGSTSAALEPAALMDAGLAAFANGDGDRAAVLLSLAVRAGPHLAPAILDGTINATGPSLLLVRGDAFRAIGAEADAAVAYAAAARALGEDAPVAALQSGPTTDSNPQ